MLWFYCLTASLLYGLIIHCLDTLLPYCLAGLLSYCLAALQPYCLAALLPHCHTALQLIFIRRIAPQRQWLNASPLISPLPPLPHCLTAPAHRCLTAWLPYCLTAVEITGPVPQFPSDKLPPPPGYQFFALFLIALSSH